MFKVKSKKTFIHSFKYTGKWNGEKIACSVRFKIRITLLQNINTKAVWSPVVGQEHLETAQVLLLPEVQHNIFFTPSEDTTTTGLSFQEPGVREDCSQTKATLVVAFFSWTLWASPGMCTHTCTCTSTGTPHRVRRLHAWPFSMTHHVGSRTLSSEGFISVSGEWGVIVRSLL